MASDNEYFLELENKASEIVEELNKLRDEAATYSSSSKALIESVDMIEKLTEGLGKASTELSTLSQSIREQGFSALTDSIQTAEKKNEQGFSTLTDSLKIVETKANTNHQKLQMLMVGGFVTVIIIQVLVLINS